MSAGDPGSSGQGETIRPTPSPGDAPSMGDTPTARVQRRFRDGDVILGRYRVTGELGQGGMGVVYRCFDEVGGIDVALKALPPELSHNSVEMEDVRENFKMVEKLHHPNIAAMKTLEKDPGTGDCYLVMECVEGVNLRQWRKKGEGGKRKAEEILPVVRQVAAALDHAHGQKIIHRDIKPSNVMIRPDGTAKVLDFGLAAQLHTSFSRVSKVHYATSGTGPYMAPEQWRGKYQDATTDQYALAVVVYELLAGRCPFEGHDVAILREAVLQEDVPPIGGLGDHAMGVLRRALSKDRKERFATCAEFVGALEGERPREPGKASRAKPPRRKGARRRGLWLVVGGLLVLAALAVILQGVRRSGRGKQERAIAEVSRERPAEMAEVAAAQIEGLAAPRFTNAIGCGSLFITTEPSGATVTVKGQGTKTSPAEFPEVPAGDVDVAVEKPDYYAEAFTVSVPGDQYAKKHLLLRHRVGRARIRSNPPGATIWAGDRKLGTTPIVVGPVEAGSQRFVLELDGYLDEFLTVDVKPDEVVEAPMIAMERGRPPVFGEDWTIPDLGMEFVWLETMRCWVGKHEVVNEEYRKFNPDHDSGEYEGRSLDGDRQPVVEVSYDDAASFAKWLMERERRFGRLPHDWEYGLPSLTERQAFEQCGDDREYPWGGTLPPAYGNYDDRGESGIDGYRDGYFVSCPVERSGVNDWGLYGVGGNVWEMTREKTPTGPFPTFTSSYMGGAWDTRDYVLMRCGCRRGSEIPSTKKNVGFRLVLMPSEKERKAAEAHRAELAKGDDYKIRFGGVSQLPDGGQVFLLNLGELTKSCFVRLGEEVDGFRIESYEARTADGPVLGVRYGDAVLRLVKGRAMTLGALVAESADDSAVAKEAGESRGRSKSHEVVLAEPRYEIIVGPEAKYASLLIHGLINTADGKAVQLGRVQLAGGACEGRQRVESRYTYPSPTREFRSDLLPGVPRVFYPTNTAAFVYSEEAEIELARIDKVPLNVVTIYDGVRFKNFTHHARNDWNYGTESEGTVERHVRFENIQSSGLGFPLPAGPVRCYRETAEGEVYWTADAILAPCGVGEAGHVSIGAVAGLHGTRERTAYAEFVPLHEYGESFEIRLENKTAESAEIRVVEHLYRWHDYEIVKADVVYREAGPQTIEFPVIVVPGGTKAIRYTVKYRW